MADPVVLLAGPGHHMYGHWLVDFLPKLFLLHRAGHDIARLRYLLPADTPAFARTWLGLLGIGADRIVAYDRERDRVACRRLLVPTALRFIGRASPLMREAARFLLDRVTPRSRPGWRLGRSGRARPALRRLLISRSDNADTHNRRTLTERAELEAGARARGFEIVRPEGLSVPEQVALFRSADVLVGEYGSGLHGSLFALPGATIVSFRDNGTELGFLQNSSTTRSAMPAATCSVRPGRGGVLLGAAAGYRLRLRLDRRASPALRHRAIAGRSARWTGAADARTGHDGTIAASDDPR
ncbi:glycosyltransferase family 61 protein [Methylorubrum suomiense]